MSNVTYALVRYDQCKMHFPGNCVMLEHCISRYYCAVILKAYFIIMYYWSYYIQ